MGQSLTYWTLSKPLRSHTFRYEFPNDNNVPFDTAPPRKTLVTCAAAVLHRSPPPFLRSLLHVLWPAPPTDERSPSVVITPKTNTTDPGANATNTNTTSGNTNTTLGNTTASGTNATAPVEVLPILVVPVEAAAPPSEGNATAPSEGNATAPGTNATAPAGNATGNGTAPSVLPILVVPVENATNTTTPGNETAGAPPGGANETLVLVPSNVTTPAINRTGVQAPEVVRNGTQLAEQALNGTITPTAQVRGHGFVAVLKHGFVLDGLEAG